MSWSTGQVRSFAKQWVDSNVSSLALMGGVARSAFLDSFVLGIVCGQASEAIKIANVDTLRAEIKSAIEKRIGFHYFE